MGEQAWGAHPGEGVGCTVVPVQSAGATTLAQHLATSGRLPVLQGLALIVQLLGALGEIHARGQVHGAISRERVFVTRSGRIEVVHPDFCAEVPMASMAPEQDADGIVDVRTDLYSAAVVAYEVLTGALPLQQPGGPPAWPPRAVRHDLPPAVEDVFRKALAQEPALRYASAQAFSLDLQEAIGLPVWTRDAPVAARAVPRDPGADRFLASLRLRSVGLASAAVAASVTFVLVAAALLQSQRDVGAIAVASLDVPVAAAREPVETIETAGTTEPAPLPPAAASRQAAAPFEEIVEEAPRAMRAAPPSMEETSVEELAEAPAPRARPRSRTVSVPRRTAAPPAPVLRATVAGAVPAGQCDRRDRIAYELCVAWRCATEFHAHPSCQRRHLDALVHTRQAELRGGP